MSLLELKADVEAKDKAGRAAVDLATTEHRRFFAQADRGRGKRLIITSGDISDVDGFMALEEYSKVTASASRSISGRRALRRGKRRHWQTSRGSDKESDSAPHWSDVH